MQEERKAIKLEEEKNFSQEKKTQGMRRQVWEKPTLEDVSQKIMAQPYIRFT